MEEMNLIPREKVLVVCLALYQTVPGSQLFLKSETMKSFLILPF